MKSKIILLAAFAAIFSIGAFAQEVKITPDKVIYKRTGADVPEHKKTFEITYPKVSGISDPRVQKNLDDTLSYWKNFRMSLDEELNEFYGVDSAEYEVGYNKNSILSIKLFMEVSGAYPSTMVKNLVVDLKTGKRVSLADVFTNIGELIVKIDKAKKASEAKAVAELKKDNAEDARTLQNLLKNKSYQVNKLDEFSISEEGVTFHHDYGFPHVIRALEPDSDYFFKWTELKPFIKPGSLLGQFTRK